MCMKIALLGYGVEGESAYRYFSSLYPEASFTVYDNAPSPKKVLPEKATFQGSVTDFHDIDADIVVRTPAIAPSKITTRGRVTSVTKEFFEKCPAPIIGVTGTKGKGTTCTLITRILEKAGKKVWLVGNIGTPALDVLVPILENSQRRSTGEMGSQPVALADHFESSNIVQPTDVVVYELSSFQLWDLEKSPHIAVVLLIEQDHQDVHGSMKDYVLAKAHITTFQSEKDRVVYHPTNAYSQQIANISPGIKQRYNTPEAAYVEDEKIKINDQIICSIREVGLPGPHNLENITAAITAAWHYTQDIDVIKKAITEFSGLPHHIEKVRELDGVLYYDDSFSSAPSATIAAIRSFTQPEIVIVGGYDKKGDYAELVKVVMKTPHIKKIILIGQTGPAIATLFDQKGETRYELDETGDFEEIVKRAKEISEPGDVVLLSPGSASFDMFKNFYQRGEKFQQIVSKL